MLRFRGVVLVSGLLAACSAEQQREDVVRPDMAVVMDATMDVVVVMDVQPDMMLEAAMMPRRDVVLGEGGGCGTGDLCDNGLDDDCDGTIDEDCPCMPGSTQRCYGGLPSEAGRGVCNYGTQRCEGRGEFGTWGMCEGYGRPRTPRCAGTDDLCTGTPDQGCACSLGTSRSCYTGPDGTMGVGQCRSGTQSCLLGSAGAEWGPCSGEVLPQRNLCDGMDRTCTGNPMTGCECLLGSMRDCYSGPAGTVGVGPCRAGRQTCQRDAEGTARWAPCMGEVLPQPNQCDGMDRACTGNPMMGCECTVGMTRTCYNGPMGTSGVGVCRSGMQRCVRDDMGVHWTTRCEGEVLPQMAEVCENGMDEDCNGMVDDRCNPCISVPMMGTLDRSPWQMFRTPGPICLGQTYATNGNPGAYRLADIPREDVMGWVPVRRSTIDFMEDSLLCSFRCGCRSAGEFTYFQTYFDVPVGATVRSFVIAVGSVDDGVRITLFNSRYPTGITDGNAYATAGMGATSDLSAYVVEGRNRLVLTHIDDCCPRKVLTGVRVELNGSTLMACE